MDEESAAAANLQPKNKNLTAEQVLNNLESEETKLLSNEQLNRYLMLQQVRVLTLQQKRLEHLNNVDSGKNVTFDFIGFDDDVCGTNPSVSKQ